jgi:outer membrane protein assembly factor BamB
MASASFRQGDEIQIGACRIFLIDAGSEAPSERAPAAPAAAAPRAPAPRRAAPAPAPAPERPLIAEEFELVPDDEPDDDVEEAILLPAEPEIPAAVPRTGHEFAGAPTAPLGRLWRSRKEAEAGEAPQAEPVEQTPAMPSSRRVSVGWGGLIRALRSQDMPPGQEQILSSPLFVILVVALVFLVLASVSLWGIIQRTVATRLYNQAVDSANEGDYRTAMRRYGEFLDRYPGDARAGKAKVFRALANVRQFTAAAGTSWSDALEAERAMVDAVSAEPAYRDAATELADLVLKTAEGLADRARGSADARTLAEAQRAVALHARVAGKPAEALLARSRVPSKLAEARAAVRKAADRAAALAAMDAALKARSSTGVYAARDALIARYADLAQDPALVARMRDANDLIRRAVTVDPAGRPAETAEQPDPLGPATSLVLRATGTGPAVAATPAGTAGRSSGAVVSALADGFACGLSAGTGAPLWQRPVGLSSPWPPQSIPGEPALLVFDARFDALVKVAAATGALLWRQPIGAAVSDPPLVLGNQVIQSTPGGKLFVFDLESGALRTTVNLGWPVSRTPVSDETGQFLYLVADRDCLFVLRRDGFECAAVEYLGHAAGSVAAAPARLGRFLVVPENTGLRDGRWRVFVIDEDGTKLQTAEPVEISGWTWSTPAAAGSVVWALSDRLGATAYALGSYDEKAPLRVLARTSPDPEASGPAYAVARSERELLVGSGRSARLELDTESGKIHAAWALPEAAPALAPPQLAGDLVVLTQQATGGPGVALWGVEPASGAVRWRTTLGAPWRVSPALAPGGTALTTLAEDGSDLELPRDRLATGGFVEVAIPRPGGTRLPPGPLTRIGAEGSNNPAVLIPGGAADHLLVRAGERGFQRVALPAPLGAMPVFWGSDLLVPGAGGRVDLLDPGTGSARAEPFVAPFDRARPTRWRTPALISGDAAALADESGRVRRLVRTAGSAPVPTLRSAGETTLGADLAADPLGLEDAVLLVTVDGKIRALAARDLSGIGAWSLDAPLAIPPALVAGRGFLADRAGNVAAFGGDGQRLWSVALRTGAAAGRPAVIGDAVWFLTRDGGLEGRALADGALVDRVDLDVLPAGDLQVIESRLFVPVGPGTFRPLRTEP